jgi:hypothetical protein
MLGTLEVAHSTRGGRDRARLTRLAVAVCAALLVFLATGAVQKASALSQPHVATLPASPIVGTSTTLNGTVNPEGLATQYRFEYGSNKEVGYKTAWVNAGSGTSPITESAVVSGSGTYDYRIAASNEDGISYGELVVYGTEPPTLEPAKGAGAFPVAFTSTGGKVVLQGSLTVECQHESASGEFTSATSLKVTIKFSECVGSEKKCTTTTTGVIETKELTGTLVYADRGPAGDEVRSPGIMLTSTNNEPISDFSCGAALKGVLEGSVVELLTSPSNVFGKSLTGVFKRTTGGTQDPTTYEADGRESLELALSTNGGTAKPETIEEASSTTTLTSEEAEVYGRPPVPFTSRLSGTGDERPKFTASGGKSVFEGPLKVECQHESVAGDFYGARNLTKEVRETITFTECKGSEKACGGAKAGTIETAELHGMMEYTYPAKRTGAERQTGVVFSAPGGKIAEFKCGAALTGVIAGSVIGVTTPLNTYTENATITIKRSTGGAQEPSEYESEDISVLPAGLTMATNGGEPKPETLEMPAQTLTFALEGLEERLPVIFIEA